MATKAHDGPLPDPVTTLERYLRVGGIELVHAVFENTFFVAPDAVRARCPYYPDHARKSNEHYGKLRKGEYGEWEGRRVRLDDNSRAQLAWAKYVGRPLSRGVGYGLRHIWGNTANPAAYTAGWNFAYMPHWAGMLTEAQHAHPLVERAMRQVSWDLYFRSHPVCAAPPFVSDPGLDLDSVLGARPILILKRDSAPAGSADKPSIRIEAAIESAEDAVRAIRRKTNQSWSNLEKGALEILGRLHSGFGTAKVEASSKSVVRRIERETGMGPEALLRFIAAERARA